MFSPTSPQLDDTGFTGANSKLTNATAHHPHHHRLRDHPDLPRLHHLVSHLRRLVSHQKPTEIRERLTLASSSVPTVYPTTSYPNTTVATTTYYPTTTLPTTYPTTIPTAAAGKVVAGMAGVLAAVAAAL